MEKEGWYYLFFGANDIQNNKQLGGIGITRARRPEGPFTDYLGKPLIDKFHNGAQPIDQFVFQDRDGTYYILYGGWLTAPASGEGSLSPLQAWYLTRNFFIGRAVLYFVIWLGMMALFNYMSRRQDVNREDRALRRRFKFWAGPGIIIYVLLMTFAAIDWVMSLTPKWASTIYGFLFVAGLENDEGAFQPCLARAANDAFELRAEGFVGQVAVRVDHRSPDGGRGDRRRSAKTSQRLAGCETTPPCASTYSFTRSFPRL